MRRENIRVIIQETFYEKKTARKIAQDTDAQVVFFAQAVDEVKEAGDYLSMIDYDVRSVAEAFKKAGGGQ